MIKYKMSILGVTVLSAFLFFMIRGFFWLHSMLTNEFFQGATVQEVFAYALRDGGYFGDVEQMLIGTIVIVLAVEYAAQKENAMCLIRYSGRSSYLNARLAMVIYTGVCVTACKFLTAYCFLAFQFDSQLVFSTGSLYRFFSGILVFSIYSVRCGIVYMIIRDLINRKTMAMGLTAIIYFLEFYIWVDNLLGLAVDTMWMPFRDLSSSFDFAIGKISSLEFLLTMVRQTGLTLLCLLIWGRIWKRRDVMNVEA